MKKIKTIFDRNWEGNRKVIDRYSDGIVFDSLTKSVWADYFPTHKIIATEKIDGTNIRVTIRNHTVVRVEKRRNPTKLEKAKGIAEPWYIDATESSEDKWIMDAVKNTNFSEIPDGEWSGEAVGLNIQGNPLNLDKNMVVFFSLGQCPVFDDVPVDYEGLKKWLPKQKSKFGKDCGIEGIVWHLPDGSMYKIKNKDF